VKIIIHYDPPPVPTRDYDYCAVYDDDRGESMVGYGATEQEARKDLLESYPRDDEP
jgi:hypothetical protein